MRRPSRRHPEYRIGSACRDADGAIPAIACSRPTISACGALPVHRTTAERIRNICSGNRAAATGRPTDRHPDVGRTPVAVTRRADDVLGSLELCALRGSVGKSADTSRGQTLSRPGSLAFVAQRLLFPSFRKALDLLELERASPAFPDDGRVDAVLGEQHHGAPHRGAQFHDAMVGQSDEFVGVEGHLHAPRFAAGCQAGARAPNARIEG